MDLKDILPLTKETAAKSAAPGAFAMALRPIFRIIYGVIGEDKVLAGGDELTDGLAKAMEVGGGFLLKDSARHPYWDIFCTSAGMAGAEELRRFHEQHKSKLSQAEERKAQTTIENIMRQRASEATPRPLKAWVVGYHKDGQPKTRWFYDRSCVSMAQFCIDHGATDRPLTTFPRLVKECREAQLEQCPCCIDKERYWDLIEREVTAANIDERFAEFEERLKEKIKKTSPLTAEQKKELKQKADDLAGTVREIGTMLDKVLAPFKKLGSGPTGS